MLKVLESKKIEGVHDNDKYGSLHCRFTMKYPIFFQFDIFRKYVILDFKIYSFLQEIY